MPQRGRRIEGLSLKKTLRSVASLYRLSRAPSRNPASLNFFVTRTCNARCAFCLYQGPMKHQEPAPELDAGEVERIAKAYGPLSYLGVSGGEPFLREDLDRLLLPFVEHCGVHVVDVSSNFSRTQVMIEVLERCLANAPRTIFDLQMSLDDLGEGHDRSRGIPGLFEKAVHGFRELKRLQKRYPNLRNKVNLVLLPENRDRILEIARWVQAEIGPDRLNLSLLQKHIKPGESKEALRLECEDYLRYGSSMGRNTGTFDPYLYLLSRANQTRARMLTRWILSVEGMGAHCQAGKSILVINEAGKVFPCEPLWRCIGDLRESNYEIAPILAGPRYRRFRETYLQEGRCNCTWACPIGAHLMQNPWSLLKEAVQDTRFLKG